jgi:rhodanese-related sulfurtransferase
MSKQVKKQSTSNRNLFIALGIVLAVITFGVIVTLMGNEGNKTSETAATTLADLSDEISPQEYQSIFREKNTAHVLLDVRTPEEFNGGHIADSTNISVETLAERLSEVPADQPIVVYCRSGNRSAQAADILKNAGYRQVYDLGGIIDWQAAGFAVEQ